MAMPPIEGQPVVADGVADSLYPVAPWLGVNIAGGQLVGLIDFIETIKVAVGKKTILNLMPLQTGDVTETFADASLLKALNGLTPAI